MNSRPRLKIEPTSTDKTLETITWVLLVLFWAFTIYTYTAMPDTVPTHFNAAGEVDKTGSKSSVWILPVIATLTVLLLKLLSRYPHYFNYPITITEQNAAFQYTNALRLFRVLNLTIVIAFFSIAAMTFAVSQGWVNRAGLAFVLLLLLLPLVPVVYFVMRMVKGR